MMDRDDDCFLLKEIDQNYDRAKEHLKNLDNWREHPDEKPDFMITTPFQDVKTKITFYEERE